MNKHIILVVLMMLTVTACSSMSSDSTQTSAAAVPSKAADYNVQLGMGYLQQGDMQRAKSKLVTALQQDPNSAQANSAMGYYLENSGDNAAERYYAKAVEVNPSAGAAQNNYGAYLCRKGRYQQAEQHFLLAVQDPTYTNTAGAYENAGLCAMQIPDLVKATDFFNKAVQNDPRRALSWLQLGQINFQQGKYKEAQQYLAHYMQLTPEPGPDALWLGIRVARQLGDTNTAGSYTLTLQSKYPNSSEYKQLLATPNTSTSKTKRPLYF